MMDWHLFWLVTFILLVISNAFWSGVWVLMDKKCSDAEKAYTEQINQVHDQYRRKKELMADYESNLEKMVSV